MYRVSIYRQMPLNNYSLKLSVLVYQFGLRSWQNTFLTVTDTPHDNQVIVEKYHTNTLNGFHNG